jgi:hypothetical protein
MRAPRRLPFPLLLPLLLAACGPEGNLAAGAVNVGAVPVLGRTLPDAVVSLVSGRDCSAVYLDAGRPYCRQPEPPPAAPPFCTRSLGTVDCWASAAAQPLPARPGVADGPVALTPAQERHRTRSWPDWGFGAAAEGAAR